VNVDFCLQFLFAVFPLFICALETVALDTPNDVQFLSQMLQVNVHQGSVAYQNWTTLHFSDSFTQTVT
jgi:hypothetical protein